MVVEEWDESFTTLDGYRGVNANMHSVEALLSAADVLDDTRLRARAQRILTRVVHDFARGNQWRIPEHFDDDWTPVLDYNVDEPAHPFRPYGATIGHWLEWARLALHLRAGLGDDAPDWLLDDAVELFDASVREGWAVDGADGFVYTVDWTGKPVVRERMHWVAAEATATAAALHAATGDPAYAGWYETWWQHVADHFLDDERGSWRHELSPQNQPSQRHLGRQAGHLPRLPGHADPAASAVADAGRRARAGTARLRQSGMWVRSRPVDGTRSAAGEADAYVESVLYWSDEPAQHADEHADHDQLADRGAFVGRGLRALPGVPVGAAEPRQPGQRHRRGREREHREGGLRPGRRPRPDRRARAIALSTSTTTASTSRTVRARTTPAET